MFNLSLVSWDELHKDASILILAVKHNQFLKLEYNEFKSIVHEKGVIYDVKSILSKDKIEKLGFNYKSF